MAMLGITNLSKVPLRIAVFAGFGGSVLSITLAVAYFIYKLIFWKNFSVGIAPLVIGGFLFGSLQLLFLGILGEYVGAIHTMVQNRPFVVEQERINFQYEPSLPLTHERPDGTEHSLTLSLKRVCRSWLHPVGREPFAAAFHGSKPP